MADEPSTDAAVQNELLRLTLRNAARSVPLQLAAVGWIAWLGWQTQQPVVAAVVAVLGAAVGVWRWSTARRLLPIEHPDAAHRCGVCLRQAAR